MKLALYMASTLQDLGNKNDLSFHAAATLALFLSCVLHVLPTSL